MLTGILRPLHALKVSNNCNIIRKHNHLLELDEDYARENRWHPLSLVSIVS